MNEGDEELAIRSRGGDRAAFEELVRRTSRLVFARLYLDTTSVHEAEDLAQETFLVAFRNIHRLSDAKAFRAWLLSIAQRVRLDAAKSRLRLKRRGRIGGDDVLTGVSGGGPAPPQCAENEESTRHALSVLRSMPEDYRQPLMLRYLNGEDYESIGRTLGITNGSLRGLLHRGMVMLRERLNVEEKSP